MRLRIVRCGIDPLLCDLDHALADLSEAVARDPAMWRARLVRAGIYEAQGDQPAAIADYQEVLQITDVDEIQARARKRLKALGVANP
jgi:predicted TPR repeat methyltransferase